MPSPMLNDKVSKLPAVSSAKAKFETRNPMTASQLLQMIRRLEKEHSVARCRAHQGSDAVRLQQLMHLLVLVLRVHAPERINGRACGQ